MTCLYKVHTVNLEGTRKCYVENGKLIAVLSGLECVSRFQYAKDLENLNLVHCLAHYSIYSKVN